MTKYADLNLPEIKKCLEAGPVSSDYHVALYGWQYEGNKVKTATNTACHAGLAGGPANCVAVWSKMMDHKASNTDRDLFINYMLKESPWNNVFLNPDVDSVLTYGWLGDADQDNHFLVNAMVATRLISEFPDRFKFFINAVKKGMDKNYAMVLSTFCCHSDKDTFFLSSVGGHSFTVDYDKDIIKRFVTRKPALNGKSYKESPRYSRLCDVWDDRNHTGYNSGSVIKRLQEIIPHQQKAKINLNIFYKPKADKYGYIYYNYDDIQYFQEQVKEKLVA